MSINAPLAPQPGPDRASSGGSGRNVRIAPVTRVSGGLELRASADFGARTVSEAALTATTFRGYENLLEGRDGRDAVFISSRACGVCGGAHALASALAMDMACSVKPPPTGVVARNFLGAMECLYDYPSHLFLRAGPDYAAPVVSRTSPALWASAEATPARGADIHGFSNISDIMTAMSPFTGALYREGIAMSRMAREAYVLVGGKFPHPQTVTPGGVSSTVDPSDFSLALLRVVKFFDYCRRTVAIWDDLTDFFYNADSRYAHVGTGPKNFLDLGMWDDPFAFDGTYENATYWGEQRWATPGAIVEGALQTTDLRVIDAGVEEFVGRSFYEGWGQGAFSHDMGGNPLSSNHPSNKKTIPQPGTANPNGKYSWSTAARWNGHPMETGAPARMWTTAMGRMQPHTSFIQATGHGISMTVPQGMMASSEHEWQIPNLWNAFERNRTRAYAMMHTSLVAYENIVIGLDLRRKGGPDARIFEPYKIPKDHVVGAGYWGGGRGYVSHHVELDARVIQNYQIVGPSTFSGSPRDDRGTPGPAEAAVMATTLVSPDPGESAVDLLRAVRSFDLCMYCAAQ